LQESLSTILLQKLYAHSHACPFVFIRRLLWHPPCTDFDIQGPCSWWNIQIPSRCPTINCRMWRNQSCLNFKWSVMYVWLTISHYCIPLGQDPSEVLNQFINSDVWLVSFVFLNSNMLFIIMILSFLKWCGSVCWK
jgi:hypothetical protein